MSKASPAEIELGAVGSLLSLEFFPKVGTSSLKETFFDVRLSSVRDFSLLENESLILGNDESCR